MKAFATRWTARLATLAVIVTMAVGGLALVGVVSPTQAQAATGTASATKKAIGTAKAKRIALKDAGFKKSQVKRLTVKRGTEDGHKVYEVEFRRGTRAYDYDIDRYTGEIVSKDVDRVKGLAKSKGTSAAKKAIGVAKAKRIALKDAGFKASQVKRLTVEKGTEDGHKVYEVEFRRGSREYQYDIDRYTGKIVARDVDYDD